MLAKNVPVELQPKETETSYKIIVAVLVVIVIGLFAIVLWSSHENLKEYNRHVCVDVYGRNENCEVIK